jgi:glycosyl-4,4'-diaponeurosporenoate acyltransferase
MAAPPPAMIPAQAGPLLTSALGWLLWSLLIGTLANRLPSAWLGSVPWLRTPIHGCESPAGYERRLAIRRWKRWLPDAGDALPGGVRKAELACRDPDQLQRLALETRRAELVHWALWPFWILTALWLPPAGVLLNLLFACLFNLPCLWLQRYNRLRLERTLRRWRGPGGPTG